MGIVAGLALAFGMTILLRNLRHEKKDSPEEVKSNPEEEKTKTEKSEEDMTMADSEEATEEAVAINSEEQPS